MPQKIHAIYVLSPQISYDTKEQARTFDTLVLFVPYNEPYLQKSLQMNADFNKITTVLPRLVPITINCNLVTNIQTATTSG